MSDSISLHEPILEKLGSAVYGALVICKQFDVAPCPHHPHRTAAECLAHLARRSKKGKAPKYFIATQVSCWVTSRG